MEQKIISLKIKTSIWQLLKFVYFSLYNLFKYICHLNFSWLNLSWLNLLEKYTDLSTYLDYSNSTLFWYLQKILPSFFLSIKVVIIACLFILIRAILPRYRFDQLMNLCWKKILPVSFSFFLFYISAIYNFSGLLYNLEINLLGNPFFHIYIFSLT